MFRIVRSADLRALHAEREELRDALRQARVEAETATDSAVRAETVAEDLLQQLGQAHADRIKAERHVGELCTELVEARRKVEDTSSVLAEMRTDLDQIRADAADPELGESFRAALAYRMLRRIYDASRGEQLGRPWDLLGLVLGFDEKTEDASQPAPVAVDSGLGMSGG